MTRQIILGTAGHIDHGKTALIRALTGVDTDRLPEEKQRGITIDIGFAHLELGDVQFGIVDVPGHERFIRNMLAGAAGIDIAMLIIAADDSIMPQTREHLAILQLLQIPAGLIVLTKCDLVDDDWIDLVEDDVRSLVRGTFLEDSPVVRTSANTGAGLDDLKRTLERLTHETHAQPRSGAASQFRLPVDRSFVLGGLGTVVTGTVWSGSVAAGEEVEWLPVGRRVRLRGLQSHGRAVETVTAGQRAALNLIGVHHSEIQRGHELAHPGLLRAARRITAHVRVLSESPLPVRHRARLRVHLGTQEVLAGVRLLRGTSIEPGESGVVQLISATPIVSRGRQPLIIRAESPLVTLGGGIVLQCAPPRLTRRDAGSAERLNGLLSASEIERAEAVLYFLAPPWSIDDFTCELGADAQEAQRAIDALRKTGRAVEIRASAQRTLLLHVDRVTEIEARLLETLQRLHAQNPIEPVVPRQRLAQSLRYLDGDVLDGVLARLVKRGKVAGGESGVALRDHAGRLTAAQEAARERIIQRYEQAAFTPPEPDELARAFGLSAAEMRQLLALCVHTGHLAHVSATIYLHRRWRAELHERIARALQENPEGMTMAQIRDLLDTTRKYALPMCEHLDRTGLTRRQGDLRVPGPALQSGATIPAARSSAGVDGATR